MFIYSGRSSTNIMHTMKSWLTCLLSIHPVSFVLSFPSSLCFLNIKTDCNSPLTGTIWELTRRDGKTIIKHSKKIHLNGCLTQNSWRTLFCKYRIMCPSSNKLGDGYYPICLPLSLQFIPLVRPSLNPSFFTRTIFSFTGTAEFKFIAPHKQHENLWNHIVPMGFHAFLETQCTTVPGVHLKIPYW